MDALTHRKEAAIWLDLRWVRVLALRLGSTMHAFREGASRHEVVVHCDTCATVQDIINAVLHECALADGRHETCVTLRHCSLIIHVNRAIRVD